MNEVRYPKLPVRVHKYLKPEHEIYISHVHHFDVQPEPFAIGIKIIKTWLVPI